MKLAKLKDYIKDLGSAGLSVDEIRTKAQALVDGETVVDDSGAAIEFSLIELTTDGGGDGGDQPQGDMPQTGTEPTVPGAASKSGDDATATKSDDTPKPKRHVLGIVPGDRRKARAEAAQIASLVTGDDSDDDSPEFDWGRVRVPATAAPGGGARVFKGKSADESRRKAYAFSRFMMGSIFNHKKSRDWCERNGIRVKAMSGSVNAGGGFLVPEQFEPTLIELRESYGVARRVLNVVQTTSDTFDQPRTNTNITAYWTAEAATITETEKVFDMVTLVAKKLAVLVKVPSELNEDAAISIGEQLARDIAWQFAYKEDDALFNGTGASTYGGIIGVRPAFTNMGATYTSTAGLQVQGSSNTWSALALSDFNGVVGRLPVYAARGGNVRWYMSQPFWGNVAQRLALAAGGVTAAEIQDGVLTPSFLGYPVELTQVMPRVTATSTICALLGDLSLACTMIERRGITIATDTSRYFDSDVIALKGTQRIDINVHDVGNYTATAADQVAGPVVGLITGS